MMNPHSDLPFYLKLPSGGRVDVYCVEDDARTYAIEAVWFSHFLEMAEPWSVSWWHGPGYPKVPEIPTQEDIARMRRDFTVFYVRDNYAFVGAIVQKLLDAVEHLTKPNRKWWKGAS